MTGRGAVRAMLGRHGQGEGAVLPGVQDGGLASGGAQGLHL